MKSVLRSRNIKHLWVRLCFPISRSPTTTKGARESVREKKGGRTVAVADLGAGIFSLLSWHSSHSRGGSREWMKTGGGPFFLLSSFSFFFHLISGDGFPEPDFQIGKLVWGRGFNFWALSSISGKQKWVTQQIRSNFSLKHLRQEDEETPPAFSRYASIIISPQTPDW